MEKNVKRIFFKDECTSPCFEMEDGTILLPIFTYPNQTYIHWITEEEEDKIINKYWEERKKRSLWKKIFSND